MNDDDDRQSDPFGSRDPFDDNEGGAERPMSYLAAAGFTLGTTFLLVFLIALAAAIRSSAASDFITKFACQVVATLLGIFFILRLYAPEASIRDLLSARRTNLAFYPLAALAGAAVYIPAISLYDFISKYYPTENHDLELYEQLSGGTLKRVAAYAILAFAGPLVEEAFFRGALFRPMRRNYEVVGVVIATSFYFAASHLEWQMMAPIGVMALVLGLLRHVSGSLGPGVVMHGVFNAIGLTLLYKYPPLPDGTSITPAIPLRWTIGGAAATLVLVLLILALGARSEAAREARRKDEA